MATAARLTTTTSTTRMVCWVVPHVSDQSPDSRAAPMAMSANTAVAGGLDELIRTLARGEQPGSRLLRMAAALPATGYRQRYPWLDVPVLDRAGVLDLLGIDIPLASGESNYGIYEFKQLIERQALDIVQPDICCCGGVLTMKKIAAMAEAQYMMVAPHNPMSPLATAVNVHFAASTPNFLVNDQLVRGALPLASFQRLIRSLTGA